MFYKNGQITKGKNQMVNQKDILMMTTYSETLNW